MRVFIPTVFISILLINQSLSQPIKDFPLASCKSWNGTIVSYVGIGTKKSEIIGTVTRDNVKEYCDRIYDNGDASDKTPLIAQCIKETVSKSAGVRVSATADCSTGRLSFTDETGRARVVRFPLAPDADVSCASGMPPLIEQFAILCPRGAKPTSAPSRAPLARLPFADGTYVTEPGLCRLSADEITERFGDGTGLRVRQINGSRLTDGYEMSCNVGGVTTRGERVMFRARCDSEGEATRINGDWLKIDDRTFRIGQRTFMACGRSIWPSQ